MGPLLTPRERHVAVGLPDGSVLLAGGLDESGTPLASAEVYVPWLPPAGRMLPAGNLTTARFDAAALSLADGSIVIMGGTSADGTTPLAAAERFVPQGPGTDSYLGALTAFVPMPGARAGAALALGPGGELLVSGGRDSAGARGELLVFVQCLSDEGLSCPAP